MPMKARKGQMLIEVTDRAEIYVPRFCYHPKLTVAANCRMCLVEIEKAPKPMPACATPVTEGMKVFTKSKRAISAQKATMEFLLINHPLDCPICDQGGECELQDLAMGFGRGVSRYTEKKRIVKDKNLGPLVSTDMTRCIHCTRCVRFTQEIAGIQELGTMGRTENVEIGTFIEHTVDHELSGNIIDVCPVGALNNKPYRYSARAWEMVAKPLVGAHDCAGSNLYAHVLRGAAAADRAARQRGDQRDLDLRSRPLRLPRDLQRRSPRPTPMVKSNGAWAEGLVAGRARTLRAMRCARRQRNGRRRARRACLAERDARGAVSLEPHRTPSRQRQHRSPPAPPRLPRSSRRSGRAAARCCDRGARAATGDRRRGLESADGSADRRASNPQGRDERARKSRS